MFELLGLQSISSAHGRLWPVVCLRLGQILAGFSTMQSFLMSRLFLWPRWWWNHWEVWLPFKKANTVKAVCSGWYRVLHWEPSFDEARLHRAAVCNGSMLLNSILLYAARLAYFLRKCYVSSFPICLCRDVSHRWFRSAVVKPMLRAEGNRASQGHDVCCVTACVCTFIRL